MVTTTKKSNDAGRAQSFQSPLVAAPQARAWRPALWTTLAFVVFFSLIIVLPNSIRGIKIAMFPMLAIFSFVQLRKIDSELLIAWGLIAATTIFYSLYPSQSRMTPVVFVQFGFVFVAAPLFWMLIADYVLKAYSFDQITVFLTWMAVASLLSIILFYYLFSHYGREAVWMFIDTEFANVKIDNDTKSYRATMHVFGSLIFIGAGFIASATLGIVRKTFVIIVLAAAAVLSGRDALVLSLGIGAGFYLFFEYLDLARRKTMSFSAIAVTLLIFAVFFTPYGNSATHAVIEKISAYGGLERHQQFNSLVRAIHHDWMLGAGNTSHVDIIRDPIRPWRYEILPLALLYRVGLFGFMCYMYPVMSSFWRMGGLMSTGRYNQADIFMIAGLTATLVSTMTNPYLESFEFQWCLFFPYCYFRLRSTTG